jgi:hypothetical protein
MSFLIRWLRSYVEPMTGLIPDAPPWSTEHQPYPESLADLIVSEWQYGSGPAEVAVAVIPVQETTSGLAREFDNISSTAYNPPVDPSTAGSRGLQI